MKKSPAKRSANRTNLSWSRLSGRNQNGIQLVELLVAVLVTTIISVGLMDTIAKTHAASTITSNQIMATNIAQQVLDNARNSSFNALLALAGTGPTNLVANRFDAGTTMPAALPRPLLLDTTQYTYRSVNQTGTGNVFGGNNANVTQEVVTIGGVAPNRSLRLIVRVNWPNENGTGRRSMEISTVINESGIHN